eukprot:6181468-Pleurochrysis_carterae.AAC.1
MHHFVLERLDPSHLFEANDAVVHMNDFDAKDYLPLVRIDDGMLLCLQTTAANASGVLPPPKNYKDIHGRPDEQEWRAACMEEFKGKVANNIFDLVKRPKNTLVCKTKWVVCTNKLCCNRSAPYS